MFTVLIDLLVYYRYRYVSILYIIFYMQYLQNREEHDRIARLWTKRYAT